MNDITNSGREFRTQLTLTKCSL